MDDRPRTILRELIGRYGLSLASHATRTEGLLRDTCGSCTREIFILVNAIRGRVPADLLAPRHSLPLPLLKEFLARRLEKDLSFSAAAADWAVASWADALGLGDAPPPAEVPSSPAPLLMMKPSLPAADPAAGEQYRLLAADLESPSLETRLQAITGIAALKDEMSIILLIGALENGNWQVRMAAFDILAGKGDDAVPFLIEALGDSHEDIVWRVVLVLGSLERPEAVDLLLALLDRGGVIRECAIWSLGECRDTRAASALVPFLRDPDPCVSREAAGALEKIGRGKREW
jgi:HEAT repeat protein